MDEYLDFPCGNRYVLQSETDLVEGRGLKFPMSALERTLVVTGLQGTGKSSLRQELKRIIVGDLEEQFYHETKFTFTSHKERRAFLENPDIGWLMDYGEGVIETGFSFDLKTGTVPAITYALISPFGTYDFSQVVLPSFIDSLSFEVRIFDPGTVLQLIKKRFNREMESLDGFAHDPALLGLTARNFEAGQHLIMQAAQFLQSQGADVYVRRSFEGLPLRIVEEIDLWKEAQDSREVEVHV